MFYCLLTWSRTEYNWINVRENRRDNQEWTIQRNWQHWVHRTQDENKQNKNTTQQTTKMSNTGFTKNRSELRRPRRPSSSCLSQDTHHVTHIVNYRLIHGHFHIGLVIIPRPPYWPETQSIQGLWKYGQFTSGHIGNTKMPLFELSM
jgi:hypothetical protein